MATELDPELRRRAAEELGAPGAQFAVFEQMAPPAAPLPATHDPVLLALRRLALRNYEDLRAMHRVAAIVARERPFGFLYLVLEEAAQRGHGGPPPPFTKDYAFSIFFALLPKKVPFARRKQLADLQARAYAEAVRRLIATGDATYPLFLSFATEHLAAGTGDPELQAFFFESIAASMRFEGRHDDEIILRSGIVSLLFRHPVPDRAAEAMVELADAVAARGIKPLSAAWLYRCAGEKMALLDPRLNSGLRSRLRAAVRHI